MARDSRDRGAKGVGTSLYVADYPKSWKTKDVLDLFERKIGNVDRVDLKDDYAFVIFKDAEDARGALEIMEGYDTGSGTLRVEMARGDQKKRPVPKNIRTKVCFVVNFDKETTTERDIQDFFQGYDVDKIDMWRGGKGISSKNYCFVTMADERAAVEAQEALDGRYLGDRQVTVELKAGREKSGFGGGGGGGRDRDGGRDRRDDRDRRDRRDDRDDRDRSSRYAPYPSRDDDRRRERRVDSRDRYDSRDRSSGYGRLPPRQDRDRRDDRRADDRDRRDRYDSRDRDDRRRGGARYRSRDSRSY